MKKKINRSALIKEVAAKNPGWKASEIAAQMKKDGVPVSLPLVYQAIRKASNSKAAGKKRGPKPKVAATEASKTNDLLASMQNFISAAGSLERAISILNVFNS
jgi:hypothetical protein